MLHCVNVAFELLDSGLEELVDLSTARLLRKEPAHSNTVSWSKKPGT